MRLLTVLTCLAALSKAPAADMVRVTITKGERTLAVDGRVAFDAGERGLLMIDRGGRMFPLPKQIIKSKRPLGAKFKPYSADEMAAVLKTEFEGFRIHKTQHFVLCTQSGEVYAKWVGKLLERIYTGFFAYWKADGLKLATPEFPLPVILFESRAKFAEFAQTELKESAKQSHGYYSVYSNRVFLYDLTGGLKGTPTSIASRAAKSTNLSTVVHEATHQIAYNCGLHRRFADNPLWLTEGLAMFFETPDRRLHKSWTAGKLNRLRLVPFKKGLANRDADALESLVAGNSRFENADSAPGAYAESWALTYFLVRTKRKEFVNYLKFLAAKPLLSWDNTETKVRDFEKFFGKPRGLDRAFLGYMRRFR